MAEAAILVAGFLVSGAAIQAYSAGTASAIPGGPGVPEYWVATSNGTGWDGDPNFTLPGPEQLNQPVVGIATAQNVSNATDGDGYWLVAADGGVFSQNGAPFYGSAGGTHLNAPMVGMAATPDGGGYWLVAADGGVFSYGDANFYGSAGGTHLNAPVVGMAAPDGGGYWLVAADGGVFTYGDANFLGSMAGQPLSAPIVGMASRSYPGGYLYFLLTADGTLWSTAGYGFETDGSLNLPAVGMTTVECLVCEEEM
jgi:hypothetical protein